MAVVSKELFDSLYKDVTCMELTHPWANSCIKASLILFRICLVGSAKFNSIVYLIQILMNCKKMLKKEQWMKLGEYYIRSTLLGLLVAVVGPLLSCGMRKSLGKYTYYSYIIIPFTLNGVFIYLEPPKRRGLIVNLFTNLLIEYYLKVLQRAGYISLTNSKKVLMFMFGSSLLFYLMRLEQEKKEKTPLIWMFTPEKVRRKTDESQNVCPHEGHCINYTLKGSAIYFGIGLGTSLARLILSRIKSPIKAISSIRRQHFRLALFASSYIGIYRAVICYLCRKRGYDSALYALPAGYAAGLSLIFNPSLGLSIASITSAFKLYSTTLYEKKYLPSSIPILELLFCICQGNLINARVMDPDVCPSYIFKLMGTITAGKIDIISKSFQDILYKN